MKRTTDKSWAIRVIKPNSLWNFQRFKTCVLKRWELRWGSSAMTNSGSITELHGHADPLTLSTWEFVVTCQMFCKPNFMRGALFLTCYFTVKQTVIDQAFRGIAIINCCTFIQTLLGLGRSFEFYGSTLIFTMSFPLILRPSQIISQHIIQTDDRTSVSSSHFLIHQQERKVSHN